MVEKGMSCVKYLLFAFNLLFFLFGAVLVGLGAYVQIRQSDYLIFTDSPINLSPVLLIVVGVITLVVAFFGCCGAIKENHCMMITFAVLVGIILVCEVGAGIAAFVLKGKVSGLFKEGLQETMKDYRTNSQYKNDWDDLQKKLKCCGASNYSDWQDIANFPPNELPSSCCETDGPSCNVSSKKLFTEPCNEALVEVVKDSVGVIAGAGIGIAVVELTGIILACCLAKAIRSEYDIA